MILNQQEIKNVSVLEPLKRYQYFLKKVADNEKLYTLKNGNNNWASSTVKNYNLYPVWSANKFASNSQIDVWSEFNVVELDLYDFLDNTLPQIEKEGFLLNVFPVDKTTGFVVKVNEFIRDINEELKNYELVLGYEYG